MVITNDKKCQTFRGGVAYVYIYIYWHINGAEGIDTGHYTKLMFFVGNHDFLFAFNKGQYVDIRAGIFLWLLSLTQSI